MPIPVAFPPSSSASAAHPLRLSSSRHPSSGVLDPDDELAERLGKATALRGLEASLAVGEAIAEVLYDGDASAWRLRSPKSVSLRGLVERANLPMTAAALCRALGVYEVWATVAKGQPWSSLSASHYRAVLDLPAELQAELLERAWREQIPSERLRDEAKARSPERRARGGRLPTHPVARMVERIEREYAAVKRPELERRLLDLERERAWTLAARCELVATRLDDLARRLRQLSSSDTTDA